VSSAVSLALLLAGSVAGQPLHAHDGPPFPIVSEHTAGAYAVSVWTDPDTTDDGTAGGQFWVVLRPASGYSSCSNAGGARQPDRRVLLAR